MEPRELLQALMERDKENSHSLAKKLGGKPSQPQIFKFLKGVAKEPRRATLEPLAAHYGIPVEAFYDQDIAEQAAVTLGLVGSAAREPGAAYAAKPAAEMQLTTRQLQLLRDLDDMAPSRASKFYDAIHEAAEEAREANRHHEARRVKVAAAAKASSSRSSTKVSYGDGNRRQRSLPLTTVRDPFTAEPDERESALYKRIERAPKEPEKR